MERFIIKDFEPAFISDAEKILKEEYSAEKKKVPSLPEESPAGLLNWLSTKKYKKAAFCGGRLVGYMMFADVWDGFFGLCKGSFSPLGGSAVSFELGAEREKVMSLLFEGISNEMVRDGIYSLALARFAHDTEANNSLILNGFGIRCSDAMATIESIPEFTMPAKLEFKEVPFGSFGIFKNLKMKLVHHLENGPVFFPSDLSDFDQWFEDDNKRWFGAFCKEEPVGFISCKKGDGENYLCDNIHNICGMYVNEEYRKDGVGRALVSCLSKILEKEDAEFLGVDYETLNPTALRFWTKFFSPYTYSFHRRIDERIVHFLK